MKKILVPFKLRALQYTEKVLCVFLLNDLDITGLSIISENKMFITEKENNKTVLNRV